MTSKHPLIVSYFTPRTPYEDHARRLKASADRLGLETLIEPRPARASWVENCAQKALFIRDVLERVDEPILWVDADACLRRPVRELVGCRADFAAIKRAGWSFGGGQIYFAATIPARRLVDRWCRYCSDYPHVWDQVSLGYAWWDMALEGGLSTLWLKETLAWKDRERETGKDGLRRRLKRLIANPAIIHMQESRSSKNRQAQHAEFRSADLPRWWKEAARQDRPFPLTADQRRSLGLTDR